MDTNTHLQGFTHIHTFIQNTRSYTHSGDVEIIRTPITHWLCEDISTLLMHVVLLKRPDLYRKLSFTHTDTHSWEQDIIGTQITHWLCGDINTTFTQYHRDMFSKENDHCYTQTHIHGDITLQGHESYTGFMGDFSTTWMHCYRDLICIYLHTHTIMEMWTL